MLAVLLCFQITAVWVQRLQAAEFSASPEIARELAIFGYLLLAGPSDPTPVEAAWLAETPPIDGRPEASVRALPAQPFIDFRDFGHPPERRTRAELRLAHSPTHLYVLVSTDAEEVVYRPRGFLVGDGLRVLLALPGPRGRSREYFDFAASAEARRAGRAGIGLLSYNFNQQHQRTLSEATRFEVFDGEGETHFEIAIAWDDVAPLRPGMIDQIGLNVYFAKAKGTVGGELAANGYSLVADEGIWDEEIGWRAYRPMRFDVPARQSPVHPWIRVAAANVRPGTPVPLVFSAYRPVEPTDVRIEIRARDGRVALNHSMRSPRVGDAPHVRTIPGSGSLPAGPYTVRIQHARFVQTDQVTVLPKLDADSLARRVQRTSDASVRATLMFRLEQLANAHRELKSYEPANALLDAGRALEGDLAQTEAGRSPYANLRALHRRAFRSALDGSYQPYSLKLPERSEPGRSSPLLVFLHGSGQDDRRVLEAPRSDGSFIELAPFGRDRYRAYAEDVSQADIDEAVAQVLETFPADPDRVVIAGFSMGGYGALRTFWQHPERYRGVAVFAGHPDLANEWLGPGHPDFTDPAYTAKFADVPVFIYHGRDDVALPVMRAIELAEALDRAGAKVTLCIEDGRGHENPGPEIHRRYLEWLERVVAGRDDTPEPNAVGPVPTACEAMSMARR